MLNVKKSVILSQSASTDNNAETSSLRIRVAEFDDLKGLTEVLTYSFHPPEGWLYWLHPLLKLGIYEDLRLRLHSTSLHYRCLVAIKRISTPTGYSEEVVGTVEITLRTWLTGISPSPYISNLAVSHGHRRQGIAQHLLLKCEQIALDWGHNHLTLHVLEDNYPARELYCTNGYQVQKIESSLIAWLFQHPRRLLVQKQMRRYGSKQSCYFQD